MKKVRIVSVMLGLLVAIGQFPIFAVTARAAETDSATCYDVERNQEEISQKQGAESQEEISQNQGAESQEEISQNQELDSPEEIDDVQEIASAESVVLEEEETLSGEIVACEEGSCITLVETNSYSEEVASEDGFDVIECEWTYETVDEYLLDEDLEEELLDALEKEDMQELDGLNLSEEELEKLDVFGEDAMDSQGGNAKDAMDRRGGKSGDTIDNPDISAEENMTNQTRSNGKIEVSQNNSDENNSGTIRNVSTARTLDEQRTAHKSDYTKATSTPREICDSRDLCEPKEVQCEE